MIRQKRIFDLVGDNGAIVMVAVSSTPASYFTRKILWTVFGGAPLFVSGGQVAQYALGVATDEYSRRAS